MNKGAIVILLAITLACTKSGNYEITKFQKNSSNSVFGVIVIPLVGCTGCINSVIKFAQINNQKASNLQIIFTRVESIKEAKLKIGDILFNKENVLIDLDNKFISMVRDVPLFFILKNKSISRVDTLHGKMLINKLNANFLFLQGGNTSIHCPRLQRG